LGRIMSFKLLFYLLHTRYVLNTEFFDLYTDDSKHNNILDLKNNDTIQVPQFCKGNHDLWKSLPIFKMASIGL